MSATGGQLTKLHEQKVDISYSVSPSMGIGYAERSVPRIRKKASFNNIIGNEGVEAGTPLYDPYACSCLAALSGLL